jgi:hypothetical protein
MTFIAPQINGARPREPGSLQAALAWACSIAVHAGALAWALYDMKNAPSLVTSDEPIAVELVLEPPAASVPQRIVLSEAAHAVQSLGEVADRPQALESRNDQFPLSSVERPASFQSVREPARLQEGPRDSRSHLTPPAPAQEADRLGQSRSVEPLQPAPGMAGVLIAAAGPPPSPLPVSDSPTSELAPAPPVNADSAASTVSSTRVDALPEIRAAGSLHERQATAETLATAEPPLGTLPQSTAQPPASLPQPASGTTITNPSEKKAAPLETAEQPLRAVTSPPGQQLASVSQPTSAPLISGRKQDLAEAVDAIASTLACSRLRPVVDEAEGSVVVRGHVSSATDRSRLSSLYAAIPGIRSVDTQQTAVVGDPYCRILLTLDESIARLSDEQKFDTTAFDKPVQSGVLRFTEGESLELKLRGPDFRAFAIVDYYSLDGSVIHLVQGDPANQNLLTPGKVLTVGGAAGTGQRLRITAPFGLEIAVAITSSQPLFARSRGIREPADVYLRDLRLALESAQRAGSTIEYAYYLLITQPR